MSFWAFLNHWWNLPSLVMLGLVGAYFALQTLGLVEHDGDGDIETDAELESELEHEVDHDAEHEVDQDASQDPEHDAEGELSGAPGSLGSQSFLGSLGMGRVPFMVVWLSLFIFAGFSGLFINRALFALGGGGYRAWFFLVSLASSLSIGVLATRVMARLAGRLVDVGGRGSTRRAELLGRPGVVASAQVDAEHGEVRVRDERGDELIVHARIEGTAVSTQGEQVVLLEYDAERGLYTCAALHER